MKVIKYYGSHPTNGQFNLQGIRTLHDDGKTYNDIQTTMAVIQWINTIITVLQQWLWYESQPLLWDDGTPILLDP